MYIQHFGLAQYPFSLATNTRYFLKLASHQRAFDSIVSALEANAKFTKITGGVGTGKTMLSKKVLDALSSHQERYAAALISNPVLDEEGTLRAIAEELGVEIDTGYSYYELLKKVSEKLIQLSSAGKTTVLLIDEAQAMPEESLEAVRLLSSIDNETSGQATLCVLLFGQPELDSMLEKPNLGELNRDLTVSEQLQPMNREELETYLAHRLTKAGYHGTELFTRRALDSLHSHSRGIPREINILAHKALMIAFERGDFSLTDTHIGAAAQSIEATQRHHA